MHNHLRSAEVDIVSATWYDVFILHSDKCGVEIYRVDLDLTKPVDLSPFDKLNSNT